MSTFPCTEHIRLGVIEHERYYRNLKCQFQKLFDESKREIHRLEDAEDETSQAESKFRAILKSDSIV